jgi:hypothetical protein
VYPQERPPAAIHLTSRPVEFIINNILYPTFCPVTLSRQSHFLPRDALQNSCEENVK